MSLAFFRTLFLLFREHYKRVFMKKNESPGSPQFDIEFQLMFQVNLSFQTNVRLLRTNFSKINVVSKYIHVKSFLLTKRNAFNFCVKQNLLLFNYHLFITDNSC